MVKLAIFSIIISSFLSFCCHIPGAVYSPQCGEIIPRNGRRTGPSTSWFLPSFSYRSLFIHLRAPLPAYAGGSFVNGLRKTNVCFAAACFSFGLIYLFTHDPRANALYCLLTQAGRSLMAQEKQMSASQPLVFLLGSLYHILFFFSTTSQGGQSAFAALRRIGSGRSGLFQCFRVP